MTAGNQPSWRRSVRAAMVGTAGVAAVAVLWRLRPTASLAGRPDTDIVAGCSWLAWALASYLCLAVAGTAIAALLRWRALARIAPATVRRLVDSAISVGLVAAVVAPTAAVASPARSATVTESTVQPRAPALDWPGLTVALPPPAAPPSSTRHVVVPGEVAVAPGEVVVAPGDTLWSIAATDLGPDATADQIAASWPRWYAANRHVIGPDPSVIHPGERLRAPTRRTTPPTQPAPEEGTP